MYNKQGSIVDDELLRKYHNRRCVLCGGTWNVAAHHCIKRSKIRLDIKENLFALCVECHTMYESSPDQFKRKFGQDKYEILGRLKYGLTIEQVLERRDNESKGYQMD